MAGPKAKITPAGYLSTREKVWQAARELGEFDARTLCRRAGLDRVHQAPRDYLRALERAGYLRCTKPKAPGCFNCYELARDTGVEAPRLRNDGTPLLDSWQSRMWAAAKILRVFTAAELAAHAALPAAPISPNSAETYCQWLELGGYLHRLPQASGAVSWRFVLDTGPKAPRVLRVKQLFDANTGEVVAARNGEISEALDEAERAEMAGRAGGAD